MNYCFECGTKLTEKYLVREDVYVYTRSLEDEAILVTLNLTGAPAGVRLPAEPEAEPLLCNYPDAPSVSGTIVLRPWEAVIWKLRGDFAL